MGKLYVFCLAPRPCVCEFCLPAEPPACPQCGKRRQYNVDSEIVHAALGTVECSYTAGTDEATGLLMSLLALPWAQAASMLLRARVWGTEVTEGNVTVKAADVTPPAFVVRVYP